MNAPEAYIPFILGLKELPEAAIIAAQSAGGSIGHAVRACKSGVRREYCRHWRPRRYLAQDDIVDAHDRHCHRRRYDAARHADPRRYRRTARRAPQRASVHQSERGTSDDRSMED